MTDLTTYRTTLLAILDDDDQARYSDDLLDAALRCALTDLDRYFPVERSEVIDATGKKRIELSADFSAIAIFRVELYDEDHQSKDNSLPFYATHQDTNWIIETSGAAISSNEYLEIFYTTFNTIEGLDDGSTTTIPIHLINLFQYATAGYAVQLRAQAISENIILSANVPSDLANQAAIWIKEYLTSLQQATRGGSFVHWPVDIDTNR
jgi:hypothetical protein